jgi:hypothetical protein
MYGVYFSYSAEFGRGRGLDFIIVNALHSEFSELNISIWSIIYRITLSPAGAHSFELLYCHIPYKKGTERGKKKKRGQKTAK